MGWKVNAAGCSGTGHAWLRRQNGGGGGDEDRRGSIVAHALSHLRESSGLDFKMGTRQKAQGVLQTRPALGSEGTLC